MTDVGVDRTIEERVIADATSGEGEDHLSRGQRRSFEGVGLADERAFGPGACSEIRGLDGSLVMPIAGLLDNRVLGGQIGATGWRAELRLVDGRIRGMHEADLTPRFDPKIPVDATVPAALN